MLQIVSEMIGIRELEWVAMKRIWAEREVDREIEKERYQESEREREREGETDIASNTRKREKREEG